MGSDLTNSFCPECYGKYGECMFEQCEYADSCRLYSEPDAAAKPMGGISWDDAQWDERLADDAGGPSKIGGKDGYGELADVLNFLLRIDDYTLEVLSTVMQENPSSAWELARTLGVSRQAIHRKLCDAVARNPELRSLLGTYLSKCRRVMAAREAKHVRQRGFRHDMRRRKNGNQMEFGI